MEVIIRTPAPRVILQQVNPPKVIKVVAGGLPGKDAASQPYTETPAGVINSLNTVFTLSHVPMMLILTFNGLVQGPGDYSIVGATITLATAPRTGDVLQAIYLT